MSIRVLIADDQPQVRRALRLLLDTEEGMEVVGEAADGREAVRQALHSRPDVVLMDLVMPGLDGSGAIRELRRRAPHVRSIALTSFGEDERVIRAVQAGALGYLLKDAAPAELLQAIRSVGAGQSYLQPRVTRALMHEVADKERVDRELEGAHHVQAGLLPRSLPAVPGWELAARWLPAHEVGGDLYDAFLDPRGRLWLAVADVAGKGLPAALLMSLARGALRAGIAAGSGPQACVEQLNELLCEDAAAGNFVSLLVGQLDTASGWLTYVNAGHCPGFLLLPGGEHEWLSPTGMVLGIETRTGWAERSVHLVSGTLLLLYTDGLTDELDGSGPDGRELAASVRRLSSQPTAALLDELVSQVRRDSPVPAGHDDITLLAVRRLTSP